MSTEKPVAVVAPALVTPNLEFEYFMDIQGEVPLDVLFYEYGDDKFVHMNYEKKCLAELVFFKADGNGVKHIVDKQRIVDFQKFQGKPMSQVTTLTGENFIDFHHRLTRQYFQRSVPVIDFSSWFSSAADFDEEFSYLRYLSLFLKNAILFGNFTTSKHESSFTEECVLPAFKRLHDVFGIVPLIVPIEPAETDDVGYWCYYSDEVRALI